jgi:hypothetical protein
MCESRIIFRFAGLFVLASLALGWFINPAWLLFTAFVGANLFQVSFTGFCPLEKILAAVRFPGCRVAPGAADV